MRSLAKVLAVILSASVIAYFGYRVGGGLKNSPLGEHVGKLRIRDVVIMLGSILPILTVHELGHLAGANLRGMRFLLLIVGPFQVRQTPSGLRFNLIWNLGAFGGLAAAMPDQQKPIRPQLLSFIAGGPLASLLLATIGLIGFMSSTSTLRIHSAFIGAVSALIFLVTIIPSRVGGFMSDGMQFLEVWRGGQAVTHRYQLTALSGQSLAGIRPREWDQQLLADLLQTPDNVQPLYKVVAHHLAWMSAMDREEAEEADRLAEWLAINVTVYPVGMRQSLTLELWLHAVRKGDLTTARRWYDEGKGGLVDQSRRHLVDAELAFAEGHVEDATRFIQSARKHLGRTMDPGMTIMTSNDLDRLELRLKST